MQKIKEKIEKNLINGPDNPPEVDEKGKVIRLYGGGLFHEFEWMPDPYDLHLLRQKEKKMDDSMKKEQISNTDFVVQTNLQTSKNLNLLIPVDNFQNPFGIDGKEAVNPYWRDSDDPYEAAEDEMLRAKWLEESKILHGDFKPAFSDKCIEKVNRSQLPDIVIYLKEIIRVDWAEINFIIGTNPEDFIEVKFEKSDDAVMGLKAYMNTLISNHETISQYNLKRVLNYWGHTDKKYIYFMLMPPWIKVRASDQYEQLQLKEKIRDEKEQEMGLGEEAKDSIYPSKNLRKPDASKRTTAKKQLKLYSAEINI